MKKKINRNKITNLFKQEILIRSIIPGLKLQGARTLFPYTWRGELRYAELDHGKLFKIIKWDKKKI